MVPIVEIFCLVDDFCKYFQEFSGQQTVAGTKKKRNRASTMTLSEVMTILILFHLSHYRTFKDFYLEAATVYLRKEFPRLVSYNRFVELMKDAIIPLIIFLNCCKGNQTGTYYVDSTKLEVCHILRTSRHKVFRDLAMLGKTSTGWFFGFKLHLVFNDQGEIMSVTLTSGNRDDRAVVKTMMKHLTGMLFGDRGYLSKDLTESLRNQGIELVTRLKKNMKAKPLGALKELLLAGRGFVETAIGQLKSICHIQHTRHRSPHNFLANLFAGLIAYTLKPKKPSLSWKKRLTGDLLMSN